MNTSRLELSSFVILLSGVSILTFFVFKPFIYIIILATVLSVLLHPIYTYFLKYIKEKNTTAFIVVFLVFLFVIIPIISLGTQIFQDSQNYFYDAQSSNFQTLHVLQNTLEKPIQHFFPTFSINILNYTTRFFNFITQNFSGFLSQTAYIFFQTFCLLFAFFFFLRDGEYILSSCKKLSPFEQEHTNEIFFTLYKTINSVIRGTLLVALVRWIGLILVFYAFGISNTILWGSIAGIVGTIPGLGTFFSFAPAVVYLYVTGHVLNAIGLALVGTLMIFLFDNLLTTYLFGKGLNAPSIFVLFSILGGIIFFGPLGFIFGPLVLSLFIAVIEMYKIILLKGNK